MEKIRGPCISYLRLSPQRPPGGRKYSISERVVILGIRQGECTGEEVRCLNAGELAGSSFSRLGVAFLRFQAPNP